jgi:hypothetical protein
MAAEKDELEEEKEGDVCRTEEMLGPVEPALYSFVRRRRTGRYQLQVDGGPRLRRRTREAYWVGRRGKVDRVCQ